MEVEFGRVSELLDPNEEIVLIKVGGLKIVKKIDALKLLNEEPSLSEEEANRLGVEAKKWARKQL